MNSCAHGSLDIATGLIQIESARLRAFLEAGKPSEEGERSRAICCLRPSGGQRRRYTRRRPVWIASVSRCRCDGGGDGFVALSLKCVNSSFISLPLGTRLREIVLQAFTG